MIPGVTGGAEEAIVGLNVRRQLRHIRLAKHDRPGRAQTLHHRCILCRYVLRQGPIPGGGADAGGGKYVFERYWHAVERSPHLTAGKGRGGIRGSDVFEGKASILYAHALANATPSDRDRLIEVMGKPRDETTPEDVAWVIHLYEGSGSLAYASETANKLIARACDELEKLPIGERTALRDLVMYMVERTR